jgi:hypothetical protein
MPLNNDFWSAYVRYFNKMRERRIHRQTVAEISELPEYLRRDIGWPGAYERSRSRGY